MNVVLSREALIDIAGIFEFIAADNPAAAERTVRHLFEVFQQLADGELKGPEVQLSDGRRLRRWSVPPYRIYYRRSSRRLFIARIYHQARRSIEAPNGR